MVDSSAKDLAGLNTQLVSLNRYGLIVPLLNYLAGHVGLRLIVATLCDGSYHRRLPVAFGDVMEHGG
jgi:hypothetical protein